MCVSLPRVDGHGILESPYGFGILMPLLVNESELILGLGVMRIHSRCFQHAAEVLAASPPFAQFADLTAQVVVRVKQKEGRGDPSE